MAPRTTTTEQRVPKRIERLFVRFGSAWGHLWHSQFGSAQTLELAKHEWARQLEGFSAEQIDRGIDQAVKRFERPPSLAQFRNLVRHYGASYHRPARLPRRRTLEDRRAAERHLSELRRRFPLRGRS